MPADRPSIVPPPPATRSAIANGSRIFPADVDGRSAEARRFKDVLGDLVEHLGGTDWASEPQKHLARRAAALVVSCERAEISLATGGAFDVAEYTTAANTLRRLLADLALKRHARDVTPGSGAIKVEHTHHVVEQADNFTNAIIALAAKRGGEALAEDAKVDGDTEVPNREDAE